ncbi:MAG: hypothetical protein ABEJ34_07965 [Haloferacaceae archaeon]
MGIIDKVKEALVPEEEETTLYELECQDCESTFMTETEPDEATCEGCGSADLEEKSRMFAGGAGGGGAG